METNQLLINYYKKEEIKKVKQRQMEGLSNNEIINLANKTYITEEEIKSLLGIENEEKNINIFLQYKYQLYYKIVVINFLKSSK